MSRRTSIPDRPFEKLAALLDRKKLEPAAGEKLESAAAKKLEPAVGRTLEPGHTLSQEQESRLFAEAMAGVTPIVSDRHWQPHKIRAQQVRNGPDKGDEQGAVEALQRLVDSGEGFVVSQTAEYMEAKGPGVAPEIARRLHQGRYAIQDHVDLHGLSAAEAEQVVHDFVSRSIGRDYRAVLIIHGRGLTSPGKPVLKGKVFEWLTQGVLRRHVIALTSARACDGGAGATYVLLRRRKWTKRMRR